MTSFSLCVCADQQDHAFAGPRIDNDLSLACGKGCNSYPQITRLEEEDTEHTL